MKKNILLDGSHHSFQKTFRLFKMMNVNHSPIHFTYRLFTNFFQFNKFGSVARQRPVDSTQKRASRRTRKGSTVNSSTINKCKHDTKITLAGGVADDLHKIVPYFQSHVVSAFEHSLSNMTTRLAKLNKETERKVRVTSQPFPFLFILVRSINLVFGIMSCLTTYLGSESLFSLD